MVRPCAFGFNPQTAVNNAFQVAGPQEKVQEKALAEFDAFVKLLRKHQIEVILGQDTPDPPTPDSIFPNNWISFHPQGMAILYPMFAPNRRLERKKDIFTLIQKESPRRRWIDMSLRERQNQYLEGTGSMIFDRANAHAYACRSPRTNEDLFREVCDTLGYKGFLFDALGDSDPITGEASPIYHTNVMMCIADKYVVICLEAIPQKKDREHLLAQFAEDGKEVVEITRQQMNHFAGNMLQVFSTDSSPYLVMSEQAFSALTPAQRRILCRYNPVLTPVLTTIEKNGGGSARCMMAEVIEEELL